MQEYFIIHFILHHLIYKCNCFTLENHTVLSRILSPLSESESVDQYPFLYIHSFIGASLKCAFLSPFYFLPNLNQCSGRQQWTVILKHQITASFSRDYSNEVIGHWRGNMWPRKQTNEIWFKFRLCLAVSVRNTDRQTWTDFFLSQSLHLLFLVFKPLIFQIFECWLSSCGMRVTHIEIMWTCCAAFLFPTALL